MVSTWVGDRISMSISVNSSLDETLKWDPLALLMRQQYEFPFGINVVQFSIFNFFSTKGKLFNHLVNFLPPKSFNQLECLLGLNVAVQSQFPLWYLATIQRNIFIILFFILLNYPMCVRCNQLWRNQKDLVSKLIIEVDGSSRLISYTSQTTIISFTKTKYKV